MKTLTKVCKMGIALTVMFLFSFHATAANTNEHISAVSDTSEVHTVVDEMPEIVGGVSALYGKIKYPHNAVRANIEGRVFIQFVVDKEGNVRDEKVLRDIGGGCGEAALEAVRDVKFTPGRLKGEVVNVQYSMPVTFRLENG